MIRTPSLARGAADVAVDLGTSTTRIAVRGRDEVHALPTVVALRDGEVVCVGDEARDMVGRAPPRTRVVQPVEHAQVEDYAAAEQLLTHALRQALGRSLVGPRVVLAVPGDTAEGARRAVAESMRAAGARQVTLIASPIAVALGAGLPLGDPLGSALLDVGGGHCEAAVVALGGLAVHRSTPAGGAAVDAALSGWLASHLGLSVGPATILDLKHQARCHLEDPSAARGVHVRGRELVSGQWTDVEVDERDVVSAVRPAVQAVLSCLVDTLGRTSPELSADIVDRGVVLAGGGSLLDGLDRVLSEATGLPVVRVEDPERCAIRGATLLLDDAELLESLAL